MSKSIDLNEFRSGTNVVILSGRPKGKSARESVNLDKIDNTDDIVTVNVPIDYKSISTSFILGMFGDSVRKLGREGFFEKYKFKGKNIEGLLERCVNEALKRDL